MRIFKNLCNPLTIRAQNTFNKNVNFFVNFMFFQQFKQKNEKLKKKLSNYLLIYKNSSAETVRNLHKLQLHRSYFKAFQKPINKF